MRWPDGDCPQYFDFWRDSTKDPRDVLGGECWNYDRTYEIFGVGMTSSGGGRDCGTAVWNTGDVCVSWIEWIGDTLSSITCGGVDI